jgi:hypothetical protein
LGQVDGIVAEPAADVEDVTVDPATLLPCDDILLGRLGVPWWGGHSGEAFGRAFAAVKGIEIKNRETRGI